MDPVTLIVAAVAAGASAGLGDVVSQSVKDGYAGLKALLLRRLDNEKAVETLADFESDPETYEKPLAKKLREAGADTDEEILRASEELLKQPEAAAVRAKYNVTVQGGKVGIIGDHGRIEHMH